MDLSNRIAAILDYSGKNMSEFSRFVGFKTPQTVRELIKGNTKTLSDAVQHKILAAFPQINKDWLLTGIGEMLYATMEPINDAHTEEDLVVQGNSSTDYRLVPLIHIDSVGGIHSENEITPSEQYLEKMVPFTEAREGDIAIIQTGSSMSPTIPPGSILLIREVVDWQEYIGYGNIFVLLLKDGRRITKEIQRYDADPKNYYWCVSYNPNIPDEELPKSFIRGVWKVIKYQADFGW